MKEKEFECIITRGMYETAQELEQEEGGQISHAYLMAVLAYTYKGAKLECKGETKCLKYPLRYAFEEIDAKREYCEKQSANGKKNGKKRAGTDAGTDENEEAGGGAVECYITTKQGAENITEWKTDEEREGVWLQELANDTAYLEELKSAYDFITRKEVLQFCKQCELKGKTHKDKADLYAHCANAMGLLNQKRDKGRDVNGKIAGAYERRTENFVKYVTEKLAASDPNKEDDTEAALPFGQTPAELGEAALAANSRNEAFKAELDKEFPEIGSNVILWYYGAACKRCGEWVTGEVEQQENVKRWAREYAADLTSRANESKAASRGA